jgi:transcriptional regulator with XRE-family HTH domain
MNGPGMLDRVDSRELGARLKAARTTIVAIERGGRRLSGEKLLALCELYGRFRRPDAARLLQEAATRYVELEWRLGRAPNRLPHAPPERRADA